MRVRNELREFFLRRVLDGSSSTAAVDRGVNRIIAEMTFLDQLVSDIWVPRERHILNTFVGYNAVAR